MHQPILCYGTKEDEIEHIGKLLQLKNVLERNRFEGLNRKAQLRPLKVSKGSSSDSSSTKPKLVDEALFILKWGGELTHTGVEQAEILG